jgi:hypothetical protein
MSNRFFVLKTGDIIELECNLFRPDTLTIGENFIEWKATYLSVPLQEADYLIYDEDLEKVVPDVYHLFITRKHSGYQITSVAENFNFDLLEDEIFIN